MKRKVFVVDDDEFFATMLHDHLSTNNSLNVKTFFTGEESLNHLHEDPELIILDYNLDMKDKNAANGLTIIKEIRHRLEHTPVILLSSQTKYGIAASTIAEGANHYIIKDTDAFTKIDAILTDIFD